MLNCDLLLSCGESIYRLCSCSKCAVCVLLDCTIKLFFHFPLLFDILNQCDNLMFRHFLFSPSLSAYSSAVLPASRLMLPLRLSFLTLPFSLPLFLSGAHRCLQLVYLHSSTPPLSLPFLTFIFTICLPILPSSFMLVLLPETMRI